MRARTTFRPLVLAVVGAVASTTLAASASAADDADLPIPPTTEAAATSTTEVTTTTSTTTTSTTTTEPAPLPAPVAVDDAATIYSNHTATVAVLANDTVPAGATLQLWNGSAPVAQIQNLYGTWSVVGDTVVHTPPDGRAGPRSIQYVLTAPDGAISIATLRVQVDSINPPLVIGDSVTTPYQTPVTVDVLANDLGGSNDEGDRYAILPETLTIETPAGVEVSTFTDATGTWTVVGGRIEFTPADEYWGNARINYRFRTSVRQRSPRGSLGVTVTPTSEAADDTATGRPGEVVSVAVTENDFTPPGTTIDRVTLVGANGNGTVSIVQPGVGTWTYSGLNIVFTPLDGFIGVASAPYRIVTSRYNTSDAIVTVTIAEPPAVIAADDSVAQYFGELRPSVDLDVLANDASEDGATLDPSTLALLDGDQPVTELVVAGEGTWTIAEGVVRFAPVAEFSGPAIVTYSVGNDAGSLDQATATVDVSWSEITTGVDSARISFRRDAVLDVLANDSATGALLDPAAVLLVGPDGEPTAAYETPAGRWSVEDGIVTFDPRPQTRGAVTATYQVDNGITVATGEITVDVTTPGRLVIEAFIDFLEWLLGR